MFSSCGQRRLWSDWADAQAGLRLLACHFVGFVMRRLIYGNNIDKSVNRRLAKGLFRITLMAWGVAKLVCFRWRLLNYTNMPTVLFAKKTLMTLDILVINVLIINLTGINVGTLHSVSSKKDNSWWIMSCVTIVWLKRQPQQSNGYICC